MQGRCDNKIDCLDQSDENFCDPLAIDKKSYRNIFPPISGRQKIEIAVTVDVRSITDVNEKAETFNAEVAIHLQWRDRRIIFKACSDPDG